MAKANQKRLQGRKVHKVIFPKVNHRIVGAAPEKQKVKQGKRDVISGRDSNRGAPSPFVFQEETEADQGQGITQEDGWKRKKQRESTESANECQI